MIVIRKDMYILIVVCAMLAGFIAGVLSSFGYHAVDHPTSDQLYGCTVAQEAPNGECQ